MQKFPTETIMNGSLHGGGTLAGLHGRDFPPSRLQQHSNFRRESFFFRASALLPSQGFFFPDATFFCHNKFLFPNKMHICKTNKQINKQNKQTNQWRRMEIKVIRMYQAAAGAVFFLSAAWSSSRRAQDAADGSPTIVSADLHSFRIKI